MKINENLYPKLLNVAHKRLSTNLSNLGNISWCAFRNENFCSISRHAKKINAGICVISRGLFFEHNAEIGQKGHFWTDAIWNNGRHIS